MGFVLWSRPMISRLKRSDLKLYHMNESCYTYFESHRLTERSQLRWQSFFRHEPCHVTLVIHQIIFVINRFCHLIKCALQHLMYTGTFLNATSDSHSCLFVYLNMIRYISFSYSKLCNEYAPFRIVSQFLCTHIKYIHQNTPEIVIITFILLLPKETEIRESLTSYFMKFEQCNSQLTNRSYNLHG